MFHDVIASDDMTECIKCGSLWTDDQFDNWHTVQCDGPDGTHVDECMCPSCLYGDDTAHDL